MSKYDFINAAFGSKAKGRIVDFGAAAEDADSSLRMRQESFRPDNPTWEKPKEPRQDSSKLPENYELGEAAQTVVAGIEAGIPFIFLTGRAGTGKSTFVKYLQLRYEQGAVNMVVVAPTGVAALNAGGQTIHSFFKFPPRLIIPSEDIQDQSSTTLSRLELLVIDEISMVRADVLDAMDIALRKWRRNEAPFGGVQILAIGDLLQLPPIVKGTAEKQLFSNVYRSPWFFDAHIFSEKTQVLAVEMKKIYRQKNLEFIESLNRIRSNEGHREAIASLNRECFRDAEAHESALTLTATNRAADAINDFELEKLDGPLSSYPGQIEGDFRLTGDRLPSPNPLQLKVGAQVMVTKNISGAVNGSLATVTELEPRAVIIELHQGEVLRLVPEDWEQYKFSWDDELQKVAPRVVGIYRQIPLMLGWAVTIHKSQGLTLESVTIDLGRGAFAAGQTYVALSRCQTKEGLRLAKPISMGDVMADPRVLEFYKNVLEV